MTERAPCGKHEGGGLYSRFTSMVKCAAMPCSAGSSPFDFLTCFPGEIIALGNCQTARLPYAHVCTVSFATPLLLEQFNNLCSRVIA
jgi:hypothetical protein